MKKKEKERYTKEKRETKQQQKRAFEGGRDGLDGRSMMTKNNFRVKYHTRVTKSRRNDWRKKTTKKQVRKK